VEFLNLATEPSPNYGGGGKSKNTSFLDLVQGIRIDNRMERRKLYIVAKILVGVGIVFYLLETLNIAKVKAAIAESDLKYLAAGMGVVLLIRILRAWQMMLAVQHHHVELSTLRGLAINTISGFYSLFLPGDLSAGAIKWHKLAKLSGKRIEVLSAIFFIRLINTTFILGFGIIGVLIDSPFDSAALFYITVSLIIALTLVHIFIFIDKPEVRMEFLLKYGAHWIPSFILDKLCKVWISFTQYKTLSRSELLKLLSVPLLNQMLTILLFVTVGCAVQIWIPLFVLVWLVSMVYIIQLIPASICGLGFRESALVFLLPHYGVEPSSAMAFSLILFGFTLLMAVIGGILEAKEAVFAPLNQVNRSHEPPG